MEIKPLNKSDYAGKKFTAHYTTNGYYDICTVKDGFRINYMPFDAPVEKSFDDVFFGEGWKTRLPLVHLKMGG